MLASFPTIAVNDAAPAPSKRRRLQPRRLGSLVDDKMAAPSGENEAEPHPACASVKPPQQICDDAIVCFGMVVDLPVHVLSTSAMAPSWTSETVFFESGRELRRPKTQDLVGRLDDYVCEVLSRLTADDELILQLTFSASPPATESDTKRSQGNLGSLSIIMYGPKRRSGDVGYFMAQCGYYLDDPTSCDRNVPYMNPQCLFSLQEHLPMTFDLPQMQLKNVDDFAPSPSDILAGFETTDRLPIADTPTAIRTVLQEHQRQALTFFIRREEGLHPIENTIGIWSRQTTVNGENIFTNTVTNRIQSAFPPIWRGGLLADEMGLGKTLSMIALVASDQDRNTRNSHQEGFSAHADELHSTLVVVPLNVLAVWKSELRSHVHIDRLTWFTHHGKTRLQLSNSTKLPHIVFTTYQTVEREKRKNNLRNSSLFSCHWKRIILDEAHIIRNHKTATARAIASLRATSVWAISGTPIQNSLTDFLGLFKSLHFAPYDDPKTFDDDISDLWRSKPAEEAIETFKKLLSCVMIRRTKAILELPSRVDKIIKLSFDYLEEEHYCRIERPVAELLDQALGEESNSGKFWLSAIQQINKLRRVCNLGTLVPLLQHDPMQSDVSDRTLAILAARLSMGGETCEQCLQPVDSSPFGTELEYEASSAVYYSTCRRLFCAACSILSRYQAPEPCACMDHATPCPLRPLNLLPTPRHASTKDSQPSNIEMDGGGQISSKVRAVISQIRMYPKEKNIVFSTWTTSLDMVQRALKCDGGIRCVRIDGKVAIKKREQAIQQFRNDPDTRVILITISCGACGLDLTAASRVHLLEPQWNPSIEDQALARAHRLGQTHPVTTLRYVMKNSIEEHILNVQDRKKLLATTLLSNDSSLEVCSEITSTATWSLTSSPLHTTTNESIRVAQTTRCQTAKHSSTSLI
ncbi:SNF2 family N-terminal domain-containing protein [Pyrenochaeta sp. MPI-SDFR-AT-0127]|nr:SNF2 family N-terminal domain-containing protein [Pyrenochaeta sp. MPI-SDFR-AT-0127]